MKKKVLSIVIPVYNEEPTVHRILEKIRDVQLSVRKEIILVDDGSTDRSFERVKQWIAENPLPEGDRIFQISKINGGKGSAFREGCRVSSGDVVIIQDADLEYSPDDYVKCITPILNGDAKVVYGSRELFSKNRRLHSSLMYYFGGLLVTLWFNFLFGTSLSDEPACYKTFSGPLIRRLSFKSDGFEFEPEITAKLVRLGYEIHEVPIGYFPRKVTEGKKINWVDGVKALWNTALFRFVPLRTDRNDLAALPSETYKIRSAAKGKKIMWLIVAVALSLRILTGMSGLADVAERLMFPESGKYLASASAILKTGSFTADPTSFRPETGYVPGYSFFLTQFFRCGGEGTAYVLFACCLGAMICVPVFYSGEVLGGQAAGVVGALLYALHLTGLGAAPAFIPDTLFSFFTAWQFYYCLQFYKRERLLDICFAALFTVLSFYISARGLFWVLPCFLMIICYKKISLLRKILGIFMVLLIFLLLSTPWLLRNHFAGADWGMDTAAIDGLYYNYAPALIAEGTGEAPETIKRRLTAEAKEQFESDPIKYAKIKDQTNYKWSRTKELVSAYPIRFVGLMIQTDGLQPDIYSFLKVVGGKRKDGKNYHPHADSMLDVLTDIKNSGRSLLLLLLTVLLVVALACLLLAGLQFLLLLWKRQWFLVSVFSGFAVNYLLLPGPETVPIHQLPALPMIACLAGLVFSVLLKKPMEK